MLDMMALAGAQHVVGFSASTFSWYLREIRCLLGSPVSVRTGLAISTPNSNPYPDPNPTPKPNPDHSTPVSTLRA